MDCTGMVGMRIGTSQGPMWPPQAPGYSRASGRLHARRNYLSTLHLTGPAFPVPPHARGLGPFSPEQMASGSNHRVC